MGGREMRELSKKNPYYLPKYRHLEMKNFALQYDDWKRELNSIDILGSHSIVKATGGSSEPVWTAVEKRDAYLKNIKMVDDAINQLEDNMRYYIFLTVTKGCTYEYLYCKKGMLCSRAVYYDHLRRFYYILSKIRK
jgi:hypothetical protein